MRNSSCSYSHLDFGALFSRETTRRPRRSPTRCSISRAARGAPRASLSPIALNWDVCFYRGDLAGAEEHFARWGSFRDAPGYRQFPGTVVSAIGCRKFKSSGSWAMRKRRVERIAQAIAFARDKPERLRSGVRAIVGERAVSASQRTAACRGRGH